MRQLDHHELIAVKIFEMSDGGALGLFRWNRKLHTSIGERRGGATTMIRVENQHRLLTTLSSDQRLVLRCLRRNEPESDSRFASLVRQADVQRAKAVRQRRIVKNFESQDVAIEA